MSPCQTLNIVKKALRKWEEVVEITMEYRKPTEEADIEIAFVKREFTDRRESKKSNIR